MLPTMTAFEQALSAPMCHCNRLRELRPILRNGRAIIRRTHLAIETEIIWNDRHYLLFLPFREEHLHYIAQLEQETRERSRAALIENMVLYNEIMLVDNLGRKEQFSVILQEMYYGMTLDKAVLHYNADDLYRAVERMKQRIDTVGFAHNNLRPANILICKSGVARPLRYWYAKWQNFADNDISTTLALIEEHRGIGTHPLIQVPAEEECEDRPREHDGITRLCKCGYYGFVDSDGHNITPFTYSWASDFQEGRAIVAKHGKMGAIDHNGAKVIPVAYSHLEFDIDTGTFTAIQGKYRYLLDYNGKRIRRAEIEHHEEVVAE